MGPIRSGEFVIGGNLGGFSATRGGKPTKIWWAPQVNSKNMPPLVVRGWNVGVPTDTFRFTTDRVAVPGKQSSVPADQRDYFFPSGITLPHAGRWLVVATSGSNWGCFFLEAT